MGCFQSSEAEPARKQAAAAPKRAAATAANAAPVAAVPVPAAPRQKIVITEVDKVKLKLKNQRDVLEQGVRKSEAVVAHDMKVGFPRRAWHCFPLVASRVGLLTQTLNICRWRASC